MSERKVLYFAQPYKVEVQNESLPALAPGQVLVKTVVSAISAGTEMLFYRGQVPPEVVVDSTIAGMQLGVRYPLSYGYCSAGDVVGIGSDVDPSWLGLRVFAFQPHASYFISEPALLQPIPTTLCYEQALFLPNMETALNFVMDARPLVGDRAIIIGLGVVGLLTLYVLRKFPLESIATLDVYAKRTEIASRWGADAAFLSNENEELTGFNPDLIFEVSSNPDALASAIQLSGFGTRIIIGSWYGDKTAHLSLGGKFHRNRISLIGSQVSTVDGQLSNRWSKTRRLQAAWKHLHELRINELITHRIPIDDAGDAYHLLDKHPDQALQIILTY